MTIDIPKWIFAALIGAAPMLGMVLFILFSCTLLGLVQRCKINLKKSYAKRRKYKSNDQLSINNENYKTDILLEPISTMVIISPFDDIPMKDIDAESTSKIYSEVKNDISNGSIFQPNQSFDNSQTSSDYDNGSLSIFSDNDYEQDRLSLIETSSQHRADIKQQTKSDTIINI